MEKFYDIITAAIYASLIGMKTLVLESNAPGGRAAEAPLIENFPDFLWEGAMAALQAYRYVRRVKK